MSKIKRITVSNLKAVSSLSVNFNGCTAIITGRNNSGKTTFLRGLFDRVRGIKPEHIIKEGEDEGFAEAELTTGEKLKWEFYNTEGKGMKEKLSYITDKDIRTSLSVELRKRFLPEVFDVDRFLQDPPKQQRITLQKLVGLDFTTIDYRYKMAYEDRESKNRRYNEERIVFKNTIKPLETAEINVEQLIKDKEAKRIELNNLYTENKKKNDELRKEWTKQCDTLRNEIGQHNQMQAEKAAVWSAAKTAVERLIALGYRGSEAGLFVNALEQEILPDKVYAPLPEPEYVQELPDNTELLALDEQLTKANEINRQAQEWKDWLIKEQRYKDYQDAANKAEEEVAKIEEERMNMIRGAKMPDGFGFSDDGITYQGLPFTREQLSSSGIYIAALKLAAMTLGEIKTLHFDASFLDKNSLLDIEKWADAEGLQLLIERPDFEGGEITYELLNCGDGDN